MGLAARHAVGYATEAVKAAIAWFDANIRMARTVCMIDPENRASVRVAEKCGYHQYARSTFKGEPTILYERRLRGLLASASTSPEL